MRRTLAALVLTIVVPGTALAATPLSRRDGFLLIWQGIARPAFETREAPFTDVPEGAQGFLEITYAKNRGVLDDDVEQFQPDAVLTMDDALVWLFRTRNVAPPDEVTLETLPDWLARYPLLKEQGFDATMTTEELHALAQKLDILLATEEHEVSLYGEKFHGDGTAFGETFDMHALTAAHRTYPHNTLVKVTNVANGKSVVVRINDRGPFIEGRDMDLSVAAFTSIAERSLGKIQATFQRMGDATLVGGCGFENTVYQRRVTRDVLLNPGVPHMLGLGETLTLRANKSFVIRALRYPDGNTETAQDFVNKGEAFTFTPSMAGEYRFKIGSAAGRARWMTMTVVACAGSAE